MMSNSAPCIARTIRARRFIINSLLAISATSLAVPCSAVVNVDPGDYTALPPGTNLGLVYYQHMEADKIYSNGDRVTDNANLNLDISFLRYVHYVELGNWIADPQIVIPFGRQHDDLTKNEFNGLGDIMIGSAFWPIHDMVNNHHLGFGVYFNLPTGDNKDQGYALSNNRYSLNLQVGYIHPLTSKITLDVVGQTEFFQDQRSTDAKKDQFYQTDVSLRYNFTPTTHVAATYRSSWGGEETLNGKQILGSERHDTAIFTVASFLTKQVQLQLQYRHDLSVEDGPMIDGIQTRLLFAF